MMIEVMVDLIQDKTMMIGVTTGLVQDKDMIPVMSNKIPSKCPKIPMVDLDRGRDMMIHIIIGQGQDKDMTIDAICLVLYRIILTQKMVGSKGQLTKADMIGQVLDKVTMNLWTDRGHNNNVTIGQGHGRIMRTGMLVVVEIMKQLVLDTAIIGTAMQIHTRNQRYLMKVRIHATLIGIRMNRSTGRGITHQMTDMTERRGPVIKMIKLILDIDLVRDTGKMNIVDQDPVEVSAYACTCSLVISI